MSIQHQLLLLAYRELSIELDEADQLATAYDAKFKDYPPVGVFRRHLDNIKESVALQDKVLLGLHKSSDDRFIPFRQSLTVMKAQVKTLTKTFKIEADQTHKALEKAKATVHSALSAHAQLMFAVNQDPRFLNIPEEVIEQLPRLEDLYRLSVGIPHLGTLDGIMRVIINSGKLFMMELGFKGGLKREKEEEEEAEESDRNKRVKTDGEQAVIDAIGQVSRDERAHTDGSKNVSVFIPGNRGAQPSLATPIDSQAEGAGPEPPVQAAASVELASSPRLNQATQVSSSNNPVKVEVTVKPEIKEDSMGLLNATHRASPAPVAAAVANPRARAVFHFNTSASEFAKDLVKLMPRSALRTSLCLKTNPIKLVHHIAMQEEDVSLANRIPVIYSDLLRSSVAGTLVRRDRSEVLERFFTCLLEMKVPFVEQEKNKRAASLSSGENAVDGREGEGEGPAYNPYLLRAFVLAIYWQIRTEDMPPAFPPGKERLAVGMLGKNYGIMLYEEKEGGDLLERAKVRHNVSVISPGIVHRRSPTAASIAATNSNANNDNQASNNNGDSTRIRYISVNFSKLGWPEGSEEHIGFVFNLDACYWARNGCFRADITQMQVTKNLMKRVIDQGRVAGRKETAVAGAKEKNRRMPWKAMNEGW